MKSKLYTLLCMVLAVILVSTSVATAEKENPGFEARYQEAVEKGTYTFDITDPFFTLDESHEAFEANDIMGMYGTFVCAWADLYNYEINTVKMKEKESYAVAAFESAEKGLLLGYVVGTDNETEHINIIMEYALKPKKSIATIIWMDYNIVTHEIKGYTTTTTSYATLAEMSKDMMLGFIISKGILRHFPNAVYSDPVVGGDALYDMMVNAVRMTK